MWRIVAILGQTPALRTNKSKRAFVGRPHFGYSHSPLHGIDWQCDYFEAIIPSGTEDYFSTKKVPIVINKHLYCPYLNILIMQANFRNFLSIHLSIHPSIASRDYLFIHCVQGLSIYPLHPGTIYLSIVSGDCLSIHCVQGLSIYPLCPGTQHIYCGCKN